MTEPVCPGCGQPPMQFAVPLVPEQAFCGNDQCHVIMWDPTKTLDELVADSQTVNLDRLEES